MEYSKWNYGTWATCEAQGFFVQISVGTILYIATLSVYYFLAIHRGFHEERISKVYEPFLHFIPLAFALGTAIAALALDQYNPVSWECYIASYPRGCKESLLNGGVTTCERGDNSSVFRLWFFYAPLWASQILVTLMMILVYCRIRRLEKASARFHPRGGQAQRFAMQAFLYVGGFVITYFPLTVARIGWKFAKYQPFNLLVVSAAFLPLQGFFNFFVYFVPRWKLRARHRSSQSTAQSTSTRRMSRINMPTDEELARWAADEGISSNDDGHSNHHHDSDVSHEEQTKEDSGKNGHGYTQGTATSSRLSWDLDHSPDPPTPPVDQAIPANPA
jgi:hypothetical protein